MIIFVTFTFEGSHQVPCAPAGHKARRLHGHHWTVEIQCSGQPEDGGWIVDFYSIKEVFDRRVYDVLDHRFLNEIDGLSIPTTENIARWIWTRLIGELPALARVIVHETPQFGAIYEGPAK